MTDFERAMDDYFDHFGESYPYAVGIGFPGSTDEENIEIIRRCIKENEPVKFSFFEKYYFTTILTIFPGT